MHKNSEAMGWILNNPLKEKLLNASDMYSYGRYMPEETCLGAFKQIAEANNCVLLSQWMMMHAAELGHVKVFQWLHEQELDINADFVKLVAQQSKVEILKAIHAMNPSLVCTVEIANAAANSHSLWKYDVLDWMHKTCKILPTNLDDKKVKKWVEERQQK
jgi:hypothetical protein